MKKVQKILAVLLSAALLFTAAGCSKSPDTSSSGSSGQENGGEIPKDISTTLEFPSWQATEPGFAEFWEYAIGEFNKTYPNVKINLYQIPFANYIDTLTTQFAAGNPPQITHLPSKNFNQFQDMGWFDALDDRFEGTDIPKTWTKMQEGMKVDGKNYGLLLLGNAYSLFYNEKMLNDAGVSVPTTVDELKDAAQKLTKKDANGNATVFGFGTASTTHSGVYTPGVTAFVIGEGSHWSNPDGSLNFSDPKLIKGINDFKYFFDNKLIPQGVTDEQKRQYFVEEKIAMIFDGPWVVSLINEASEDVRSHFKVTSIPFPNVCGAVSNSVHIPASIKADEKDLVWEFYKVLASPEAQSKYAEFTNSPPPKAGAITKEIAEKNPFLEQMAQDANKAVSVTPPGYGKNYNEFTTLVIDSVLNLVSDPNAKTEDMLAQLEKDIKDTIQP